MIKARFPDSIVCTDVALDPYSDQGHDGVVKDGKILNDETIMQLTKQVALQSLFLSCVSAKSIDDIRLACQPDKPDFS